MLKYLIGIALFFVASCDNDTNDRIIIRSNHNNKAPHIAPEIKMDSICDSEIERVGQEIIDKMNRFEHIIDLQEIEKKSAQIHDVHLLDYINHELTISLNAISSCASGCTGNLLMIFDEELKLLYTQQLPSKIKFIDYNNDGVHEIYSENLILWNDTCAHHFKLKQIGKPKALFHKINKFPKNCASEIKDQDTIFKELNIQFTPLDHDEQLDILVQTKIHLLTSEKVEYIEDSIFLPKSSF